MSLLYKFLSRSIILQHRVAVQTQVVLDHAVSNLLGHLMFGHLVLGQVAGGELGGIDAGGEAVILDAFELNLLQPFDKRLGGGVVVIGDLGEVDHDNGETRGILSVER